MDNQVRDDMQQGSAALKIPVLLVPFISIIAILQLVGCDRQPPHRKAQATLSGGIGRAALNVPADAVFIWEVARRSSRSNADCGQPLASAALKFLWPEMEPSGGPAVYWKNRSRFGPNGDANWLEIGMSQGTPSADVSLKKLRDSSLYRRNSQGLPPGFMFEYGFDAATGLEIAYPNVARTEARYWNRIFYSDAIARSAHPTTLISCMTGPQFNPPEWTPSCSQSIVHDDFDHVSISITYRENLLPHWQQIEADVRAYLDRISSRCPA